MTLPAGVKLRGAGGHMSASTTARFKGTWLRGAVRFSSNVSVRDMKIGDRLSGPSVAPAGRSTSNVRFTRVRFRGGGYGGAIFAITARSINRLYLNRCRFERNLGQWSSNGGAGALWFAADTSMGTVIRNVSITRSAFGVTNGRAKGQPTFNIVFWQSEESGSGWWGDITIANNTFETTDEFNLDFDGLRLRDNGHNNVIIRGNLIKGGGKIRADGSKPSWGYTICTEPTRRGTIIENNKLYTGFYNVFKTTKNTTDTVFRNNTIDLTVANGVRPYYSGSYRTINLYEGARNRVTGNLIRVPAGRRGLFRGHLLGGADVGRVGQQDREEVRPASPDGVALSTHGGREGGGRAPLSPIRLLCPGGGDACGLSSSHGLRGPRRLPSCSACSTPPVSA